MALEMIEGLLAVVTLVKGLAGGASEFADEAGIGGVALRAFDLPVRRIVRPGHRGSDPVFFQFLFSFFRHPVGGPCR